MNYEVVCFGYWLEEPNPLKDRRIFCASLEECKNVYLSELYNPANFSVQAREYKVNAFMFRD